MAFLNGGSFFFMPEPYPVPGSPDGMCKDLAINVLRSLQFSYMLMKGLRSTSRALNDLDLFRNVDTGETGGRIRWRTSGSFRGRGATRLGSGSRVGRGGFGVRRSSLDRERIGRAGEQARSAGDDLGTRASGKEKVNGNVGGARATSVGGDSNMVKGIQDGKRTVTSDKTRYIDTAGEMGVNTEGSTPIETEREVRVAAESVLVSKFSSGMTNRTLSLAGLGAVDGISNHLKPMKGFMKSVKMATGVVSGVKTATGVIQKFQAPAGGVLMGFGAANGVVLGFETARMIVKGAKISKDFVGVWKSTRAQAGKLSAAKNQAQRKALRDRFLKGLKASDGALTLVKLTKEFGSVLGGSVHGGFSNWDMINKSYDASNSALKIFEAVLGVKGGGVVGLVGKGFVSLKGAVAGLGMSLKLVKAVVISKEVSVFLLKGFGLSKTVFEAFKAIHDGKEMVKWIILRRESSDVSKKTGDESLLEVQRIALLKAQENTTMLELLLVTGVQRFSYGSQDLSSSLILSLAFLLVLKSQASDGRGLNEDVLSCSTVPPSHIFTLSLPVPVSTYSSLLIVDGS